MVINMEKLTDYGKIEKNARARKRITNTITYIFLILWAVVVLFPFYWMVLTSVKSYSSYNSEYIPKFFTLSPTLQNYKDAFTTVLLLEDILQIRFYLLCDHGDYAGGNYSCSICICTS